MRVSLREDDPGYKPRAACDVYINGAYDVYLNKRLVNYVITADTELGEVLSAAVDDSGRFIIEGDEFVETILRGRVEIKPR